MLTKNKKYDIIYLVNMFSFLDKIQIFRAKQYIVPCKVINFIDRESNVLHDDFLNFYSDEDEINETILMILSQTSKEIEDGGMKIENISCLNDKLKEKMLFG